MQHQSLTPAPRQHPLSYRWDLDLFRGVWNKFLYLLSFLRNGTIMNFDRIWIPMRSRQTELDRQECTVSIHWSRTSERLIDRDSRSKCKIWKKRNHDELLQRRMKENTITIRRRREGYCIASTRFLLLGWLVWRYWRWRLRFVSRWNKEAQCQISISIWWIRRGIMLLVHHFFSSNFYKHCIPLNPESVVLRQLQKWCKNRCRWSEDLFRHITSTRCGGTRAPLGPSVRLPAL